MKKVLKKGLKIIGIILAVILIILLCVYLFVLQYPKDSYSDKREVVFHIPSVKQVWGRKVKNNNRYENETPLRCFFCT